MKLSVKQIRVIKLRVTTTAPIHIDKKETIKTFLNLDVSLGFDHENYHHISILSSTAKKSLVEDFDLESI